MPFNPIAQGAISSLGRVVEAADEIKGYAENLVAGLRDCFNAQSPKSRWGVDFQVETDKVSSTIESVFGKARSGLFIEVGDVGLYGRYVIEKQVRVNGESVWTTVWAIRIARDGSVHDGDTGPALFNAWQSFEQERTAALHHLAGSIVYIMGKTGSFAE
ncbi:hypothetical protein [Pseudomonas lundensis]|uniref:hypothetical protein n=1 Tax=Pseudomonas lundensis TaxID=86185 RepID=UPI00064233E9|nr:hypothetical protein [Pseudomonas lundensis]